MNENPNAQALKADPVWISTEVIDWESLAGDWLGQRPKQQEAMVRVVRRERPSPGQSHGQQCRTHNLGKLLQPLFPHA